VVVGDDVMRVDGEAAARALLTAALDLDPEDTWTEPARQLRGVRGDEPGSDGPAAAVAVRPPNPSLLTSRAPPAAAATTTSTATTTAVARPPALRRTPPGAASVEAPQAGQNRAATSVRAAPQEVQWREGSVIRAAAATVGRSGHRRPACGAGAARATRPGTSSWSGPLG
jgi:hypothetical protein